MKRLGRLISLCSVLSLGVITVPFVARAAEPAESEERSESTTESKHYGMKKIFEDALAEVQLRPDQREAIDVLRSEGETRRAPIKAAKRELMLAVADQIEKGDIDSCALAPEINKVASAMAAAHPGDRQAFEQLHAILDPDQRVTFADALKRAWYKQKRAHEPSAMVAWMTREVRLSDEQKERMQTTLTALQQIREASPAYEERRQRWTRILDAFKTDRFVLDEVAPMGDVTAKRTAKIENRLAGCKAVIAILTPDQRAVLAQKLRNMAVGLGPVEREGAEEGTEQMRE